ncbi:hypothetical protein M0802_004834 [Mischocyttarus mexicanus]|nr:hypothetical protein M0802_004834 [Mischocyttarus mexicanus]
MVDLGEVVGFVPGTILVNPAAAAVWGNDVRTDIGSLAVIYPKATQTQTQPRTTTTTTTTTITTTSKSSSSSSIAVNSTLLPPQTTTPLTTAYAKKKRRPVEREEKDRGEGGSE